MHFLIHSLPRHFRHAALLAAVVTTASAEPRFLMKIADPNGTPVVPGDCTEPGHEGWIQVEAFGQGIHQPLGAHFIGKTDFAFHKRMDAASPHLAKAALEGKTFDSVEIHCLDDSRPGFAQSPTSLELRHVRVSGYRTGGGRFNPLGEGAGALPMEEVTLVWSEIVVDYRDYDSDGTLRDSDGVQIVAFESTEDPNFDDDGDGLSNPEDPDDDNDAIDDTYEIANGLDPFRDDADADLDGDQHSNYDEAVADTKANDPTDFFGIDSIVFRHGAEGLEAAITLTVTPGRRYRLLATPDPGLPRDQWIVADQFEVAEDDGDGPVEIIVQGPLVANSARLFFAAEVDLAP